MMPCQTIVPYKYLFAKLLSHFTNTQVLDVKHFSSVKPSNSVFKTVRKATKYAKKHANALRTLILFQIKT